MEAYMRLSLKDEPMKNCLVGYDIASWFPHVHLFACQCPECTDRIEKHAQFFVALALPSHILMKVIV